MSAAFKAAEPANVTQFVELQAREAYWQALNGLAKKGKVPGIKLGHLAIRVLMFLLGQRPGYFGHHKVIAEAVETNLTSLRAARETGLLRWDLVPPHHQLPTGKYTRTNVNRYFVQTDALLVAPSNDAPRQTVASTHWNSGTPFGTDPRFEQHPPLPPDTQPPPGIDLTSFNEVAGASKLAVAKRTRNEQRSTHRRPADGEESVPSELDGVLDRWRALGLGDPDDRSKRALRNRYAEGAPMEQLQAAVQGAAQDDWLRRGRAIAPFAVVFATVDSVARFAAAGLEHARAADAAARQKAAERRAQLDLLAETSSVSKRAENAEHAAAALRRVLAAADSLAPSGALL